jgi:hypothetical protein
MLNVELNKSPTNRDRYFKRIFTELLSHSHSYTNSPQKHSYAPISVKQIFQIDSAVIYDGYQRKGPKPGATQTTTPAFA